jgi:peptidoglycan/LPS O-acetylase OafA/YrhL
MEAGRTTGFDYLRLGLATAVLCSHSIDVSYGLAFAIAAENGPTRPLIALILPMFFALSGFLVAGSLERCRTLVSFMGLRVLRLAPALAVETVIAALLLGPILTSLPLADYFSDPQLPSYFLNVVGDIQYRLPGLFSGNPWADTVNAQLWTLPFELGCYLSLFGLALCGLHKRRILFAGIVAALNIAMAVQYAAGGELNPNPVVEGQMLVVCFLWGIVLYLYRNAVAHSARLGAIAALASIALLVHPATDYLVPVFAAYLTAYLGLMRPKAAWLVSSGDYSYGVFLFGFPVQQAVAQLLGPGGQNWLTNIALSLPVTLMLAILSWHLVEKPALRLRTPLKRLEDRVLELGQAAGKAWRALRRPAPVRG